MEDAGLRMEDVIGDNMRVMCIDPPPVKKNDDNGKKMMREMKMTTADIECVEPRCRARSVRSPPASYP